MKISLRKLKSPLETKVAQRTRKSFEFTNAAAQRYFARYSGSGRSYAKVWRDYSYCDEVLEQFTAPGAPRLKSICVLGTGPGQILKEFAKKLPVRVYGCEVNEWAFRKIPVKFRKNVKCESMQKYLRDCARKNRRFDLIFSNSLVYLEPSELGAVLDDVFATSKYFHFNCSFLGKACPDPYRKILRSKRWWNRQFVKHGFRSLKNARGHHTYLWLAAGAP